MFKNQNSREEKALAYFRNGYNCSQSVFAAYSDLFGIEESTALKLATPFGGGFGGSAGTCGSLYGVALIAGLAEGSDISFDEDGRKETSDKIQRTMNRFEEEFGVSTCRHFSPTDERTNKNHTAECEDYIRFCSSIIENDILITK